jgi:hypothetical protein
MPILRHGGAKSETTGSRATICTDKHKQPTNISDPNAAQDFAEAIRH